MQLSNWLIFCGVALLTTFTPGPAVLLAIANAIDQGPRRALICSSGNALGLIVVAAIATAGMSAILATSASAFIVLKFGGAAYLIYLGVKQWRRRTDAVFSSRPASSGTNWRLFSQGIAMALTNPKGILFFSALFPQFLVRDVPLPRQFVVLAITFSLCALLSHSCYALLAHKLRRLFASPQRMRRFNRVTGGLFVALGLALLRLQQRAA